jgi:hypothetical protein
MILPILATTNPQTILATRQAHPPGTPAETDALSDS